MSRKTEHRPGSDIISLSADREESIAMLSSDEENIIMLSSGQDLSEPDRWLLAALSEETENEIGAELAAAEQLELPDTLGAKIRALITDADRIAEASGQTDKQAAAASGAPGDITEIGASLRDNDIRTGDSKEKKTTVSYRLLQLLGTRRAGTAVAAVIVLLIGVFGMRTFMTPRGSASTAEAKYAVTSGAAPAAPEAWQETMAAAAEDAAFEAMAVAGADAVQDTAPGAKAEVIQETAAAMAAAGAGAAQEMAAAPAAAYEAADNAAPVEEAGTAPALMMAPPAAVNYAKELEEADGASAFSVPEKPAAAEKQERAANALSAPAAAYAENEAVGSLAAKDSAAAMDTGRIDDVSENVGENVGGNVSENVEYIQILTEEQFRMLTEARERREELNFRAASVNGEEKQVTAFIYHIAAENGMEIPEVYATDGDICVRMVFRPVKASADVSALVREEAENWWTVNIN